MQQVKYSVGGDNDGAMTEAAEGAIEAVGIMYARLLEPALRQARQMLRQTTMAACTHNPESSYGQNG